MTLSAAYRPDPKFMRLGRDFADPVDPADFPDDPILRYRNDRAAASVGLDGLTDAEWLAAFGRFEALPDNQPGPLAMRYHGHQFRSYNPDLGDGRGFLFAQLREAGTDRLLDLATKGSGQTPWSRQGDGRLTLKGGVREILAADLLEALGVPTSRAFSPGRDRRGPAARRRAQPDPLGGADPAVAQPHPLRHLPAPGLPGAARQLITVLVDHAVETYYPHRRRARPAQGPAGAVVAASARLLAGWMAAGFVHGVLNTDNMVVTGESFDYGPWRFLPRTIRTSPPPISTIRALQLRPPARGGVLEPAAAGRLPGPGHRPGRAARGAERLLRRLSRRPARGDAATPGLKSRGAEDRHRTGQAAFKALASGGDEPCAGSRSSSTGSAARRRRRAPWPVRAPALYGEEAFADFRRRLAAFEPDRPERLEHPVFARDEPEELLIEEVEALWAPIAAEDDWSPLYAKLDRIEAARVGLWAGSGASAMMTKTTRSELFRSSPEQLSRFWLRGPA
jgi:hypothetical protein